MKNHWGYLFACCSILFAPSISSAQDSIPFKQDSAIVQTDSARQIPNNVRVRRSGSMSSLFTDSAKLTSSDYQLQIEKAYLTLSNIQSGSDLGPDFNNVREKLADGDSILAVLKENVLNNTGALSLRNLQVFRTLLLNVELDLKAHREFLDSAENRLTALRSTMKVLIADTVLKQLLKDTVMRRHFAPQLENMREVWGTSTRHLRKSIAIVNILQTHTSSNSITTTQLLQQVNNLYNTSAIRIFGKEYKYLWETNADSSSQGTRSSFEKAYTAEKKALRYYFKDTGHNRVLLLLIGLLFFIWTYRNKRALKRMKEWGNVRNTDFYYLPSGFIVSSLVIIFSIAPLFDLLAPSAYIESIQFLFLIILTIICWRKWPRKLFIYWVVMTTLYICFSFTHHMVNPGFWQRCSLILLNVLSVSFGLLFLSEMKQQLHLKGFLRFVIVLHNVMNVLSIIFNIWGRVSLAQILGNAAIFAFTQAIGLSVFFAVCMEAIRLQIVTSRTRNGVQGRLDYQQALTSFSRPVMFLVVVLWLIVFATNLNVYTSVLNWTVNFLQLPRHVGSASFTLGGIFLFFMIIWIAHLLQKYVGYFFGDTGTDDDMPNKGQRSRLLIARLVLLCLGYLLAVAASGVPVDRITIVLGALGVGIGLGLQNIVNNFVSGIILIFDRPLQIGDIVEVSDISERIHTGRVREIGLRSSTLLTQDGAEVIIPNGNILSQLIVNWTLSNNQQRLEMELSVSGSTDMEVVSSLIKEVILSSKYVVDGKEPQILFTKVSEDGFELKVFFWCTEVFKSDVARSEVLLLLHKKLNSENLNIK